MAVNWSWKNKMGTMTFSHRDGEKYKVTLYQGNCLGVMIYHYTGEDKHNYSFDGCWLDLAHLKRCLGLAKGHDNIYNNIVKIRLNVYYKECLKIAELFAKANIKTILYYEEEK